MPTENKTVEPGFDLNTPDGGRGYIADLFKTVLKRHDYRQYIAERLAGDFACTLAQHFEDVKAREQALQLRLNAADQRADELETLLEQVLTNASRALPSELQRSIRKLLPAPVPAPANEEEREPFEAWHRRRFSTKHSTGQPTRDMHNGIHDPNYGPPDQQHMWEAWQARAALKPAEAERDHQIPCTSGMRLNMLASQGE